jgi:predicted nuclease of restriction endonuclease-like RecB superfamily
MLPSELLIYRQNGETIVPKKLTIDDRAVRQHPQSGIALATDLIDCFQDYLGKTQGELNQKLTELEGNSPDYRVKRGLAHLLRNNYSTFEIISPLEPQSLRKLIFAEAAKTTPIPHHRSQTIEAIAHSLSKELNRAVVPSEVERGIYADLQENRLLTQFDPPLPEALIHRYNLSQVQGIFYRASHIIINAYRNDPGEYKLLFRYLKLFQLMAYIEGDADTGFTITIDGPTSLFKPSTRYGLALAKMIPALLHVSKWSLQAKLQNRDPYSGNIRDGRYTLSSDRCGLISHYPPGKPYDSMLEASFAKSWAKSNTEWRLEREVDLVPLPGGVMIPDFRLVHPDGRDFLLEIVGYWRPEYLKKKFSQVRHADVDNLILAVSERLNLEKAGVKFSNLPNRLIWFKDKLLPKAVLEIL